MADARRSVNIAFDGNTNGLRRASADANQMLSRVGKSASATGVSIGGMLGRLLLFGPIVLVVAAAAKAAAGFILLIPAAILSLVAVIGTGILAMKGFGEAVAAATPEEFVTATRSMSPAMRDAVNTVRRARPEFYALRRLVQEGFWTGFSGDLRTLLASYLPVLNARLPQVASGIAGVRSSLVAALVSPRTVAALDSFLRLTNEMLIRMKGSIGDFLAGFIQLANIGGSFLPRFGTWLSEIAQRFRAWVDAGEASGSIAAFIEDALTSFRDLATIFGNIYGMLVAIVNTLTGVGALDSLIGITAALRRFFESDAGSGLLTVLGAILDIMLKIITVILNAVSVVSGLASTVTGGGGGGIFSAIGGFFSNLFGRAGGGPVTAGQSYVVGERGREILTMGQRGFVTPNGVTGERGSGGQQVLVNVYIGETELRGIVETEVRSMVRDTARSVYSGLGVAG